MRARKFVAVARPIAERFTVVRDTKASRVTYRSAKLASMSRSVIHVHSEEAPLFICGQRLFGRKATSSCLRLPQGDPERCISETTPSTGQQRDFREAKKSVDARVFAFAATHRVVDRYRGRR